MTDPSSSSQAWDFVVRRANLQLVDFASRAGGIILVDSTRRGKVSAGWGLRRVVKRSLFGAAVPPAANAGCAVKDCSDLVSDDGAARSNHELTKPSLHRCTVINRANKIRGHLQALDEADVVRDMELYTPSNIVSPTERAQILARIDGWVQNLLVSLCGVRIQATILAHDDIVCRALPSSCQSSRSLSDLTSYILEPPFHQLATQHQSFPLSVSQPRPLSNMVVQSRCEMNLGCLNIFRGVAMIMSSGARYVWLLLDFRWTQS